MRIKELQVVITFPTTAAALAMERRAKELGIPGRLIPTPTVITANCGLAWLASVENEDTLKQMLGENGLQHDDVLLMLL